MLSQRAAVWSMCLGAASAAMALYLLTASRTITWRHGGADGAELAAAAYVLGVPHPTGYPLYMLLAHGFSWLPVGEVAFRVGLLSAAAAAATVGLGAWVASQMARDVGSPALAAGVAGVALAVSPMLWSQATIPEVHALHAALVTGGLALLTAWRPGNDGVAIAFAGLAGLGLCHHLTLSFLVIPGGMYLLLRDSAMVRRPAAPGALLVLFAGLSLYLYLPLRAGTHPPVNWGNPVSPETFLTHVTARSYAAYWQSSPDQVAERIPVAARLIGEQLTWPGLVVALVGFGAVWSQRRPLGWLLLADALLTLSFALTYRARDGEFYLLPLALILCVGFGVGLANLAAIPRVRWGAIVGIVILGAWQVSMYFSEMDLRSDRLAIEFGRSTLMASQPGALIISDRDDHTFALWYVQVVEGVRTDVPVVDRRLLGFDWYVDHLRRQFPSVVEELRT